MTSASIPSLEEFLVAPIEVVAEVAPATVVYGVGGTRRHAVLEGIEPWSDQFMQWVRQRMFRCIDLIFRHGVGNLLIIAFTPDTLREVNRYRGQLLDRTEWILAGAESLADYDRYAWRVRLLGTESVPELNLVADTLKTRTAVCSPHTLYFTVVSDADSPWQQLLAATQRSQARTQQEAIRALYGEDISPATLYLAFGKPMISPPIIPPLLIGQLQCYWSQQPGYSHPQICTNRNESYLTCDERNNVS